VYLKRSTRSNGHGDPIDLATLSAKASDGRSHLYMSEGTSDKTPRFELIASDLWLAVT
jgi:hypothetical protein